MGESKFLLVSEGSMGELTDVASAKRARRGDLSVSETESSEPLRVWTVTVVPFLSF